MSIDTLADKIAEIATTLQGPGLDVARAAARTEAYSSLMLNVVLIAFGVFAGRKARAMFKADPEVESGVTLAWLIGGSLAVFLGALGLIGLLDPWLWTTMASPEQWLAKKALNL